MAREHLIQLNKVRFEWFSRVVNLDPNNDPDLEVEHAANR